MLTEFVQDVAGLVLGGLGPVGLEPVALALGLLLSVCALILLLTQFAADAVAWWRQPKAEDDQQGAKEIVIPTRETSAPDDSHSSSGRLTDPWPEADHQPGLRSIMPPVVTLNALVTPPPLRAGEILSMVAAA